MFSRSLLLLSVVLLLTGCAAQRIPFNEAEYAARPKTGDKVVTGAIFLVDQLEEKQVGAHSEITLEPITSYSNQWFEASYLGNSTLAAPDQRYSQYVRKTKADQAGNFTFEQVAPGEYYLSGLVKWKAATCSGNVLSKKIPIARKLTVAEGDTRLDTPLTKPFVSPSEICNLYNQSDWSKE